MPPTILKKGKLVAHKYSENQQELDTYVPINYIMKWFGSRLNKEGGIEDRIMILESSTGSGKSTVLPPEFFHLYFNKTDEKTIAVTQPKVLTATQIPYQVTPFQSAEFLKSIGQSSRTPIIIGENIGYQTGNFKLKPPKGIIYMTIGVLQQQLNVMSDEDLLLKYSLIVIDEVHIRSMSLDLTLYLLKQFIKRNYNNPKCPFVVLTSATFDVIKMTDYMLSDVSKSKRYKNIIKVSGLTYPVVENFLQLDSSNYYKDTAKKVIEIHTTNIDDICDPVIVSKKLDIPIKEVMHKQQFRDILIFAGGSGEMGSIMIELKNIIDNTTDSFIKKNKLMVIPLSSVDVNNKTDNYFNVLKPREKLNPIPSRRVILSTNVAETGITIESLRYVIETGYVKSSEYNSLYNINILITKPVTKGMYKQRKGRAGRLETGACYAMYTNELYNQLQDNEYPDILKENISLEILSLIINQCDIPKDFENITDYVQSKEFNEITKSIINFNKIDLLDIPSSDMLHGTINNLYTLGAIYKNCTPTKLGLLINKFRKISIESIRMILIAYSLGAPIMDIIIIASFINSGMYIKMTNSFNIGSYTAFMEIFSKKFEYDYTSKLIEILSCDFITSLLIFYEFQNKILKYTKDYFKKNKILNFDDIKLKKWCEKFLINLDDLLYVIEIKDEIVKTLIGLKLNPYQNNNKSFDNINFTQTKDYIKLIKQCIYEGYKMNILVWNNIKKQYYTLNGKLSIKLPKKVFLPSISSIELYNTQPPNYLLYDSILYSQSIINSKYFPKISYITVLDGYINFDKDFIL